MSVERLVMSVRDWQNRLEANFLEDTVLSAKIHGIVELEFQARIKFETDFQGYSKLSDSCTAFF